MYLCITIAGVFFPWKTSNITTMLMHGRCGFSVAGPMAWNALPDDLRDPSLSDDNFRKTLKTHLFWNALGHLAH